MRSMFTRAAALALALALFGSVSAVSADTPTVGKEAKDFTLTALDGGTVTLSKQAGPVILVVLRGYPGYQCPLCSRQVAELIGQAEAFKKAGATVLLVYPGPADKLKERAFEFVKGKNYPNHFRILLDPDYAFTTAYGLRWDAKNETAYPSTFVFDTKRTVLFAKVSKTHGDRAKTADVLKAVAK